jgi:hypothetical protein
MKSYLTVPAGMVLSLALLGACSKPADPAPPASDVAAAAPAAPAAPPVDASASSGGVVSPPASNGALNTDANTTAPQQAAASNSFTKSQAKGHIENAGYSDVSGMTKTPDGMWVGQAKKDGKPVTVSVDFKGAVSAK